MPYKIPLLEPVMSGLDKEMEYVKDAIEHNWLMAGPYIELFEEAVAKATEMNYAVAVSSGTAALHLALLGNMIEPGDEVIMPTLTFIATANAVRYCGATPVFVDVEPDYMQIDVSKIEAAITKRTKAILPVWLLGHPPDLFEIYNLAYEHELAVIEDATEALGSKYRKPVRPDLARTLCYSFNGNKIITAAGGGMVTTNSKYVADRVRHLSGQARIDKDEYFHDMVGYNYRMSNIQAAIGLGQLDNKIRVNAKRVIASTYQKSLNVSVFKEAEWARSNYWLSAIQLIGSRQLKRQLAEVGIETRPIFCPLHISPIYARPGVKVQDCPVARQLWRDTLCLPSSVNLTHKDQKDVCKAINELQPR